MRVANVILAMKNVRLMSRAADGKYVAALEINFVFSSRNIKLHKKETKFAKTM